MRPAPGSADLGYAQGCGRLRARHGLRRPTRPALERWHPAPPRCVHATCRLMNSRAGGCPLLPVRRQSRPKPRDPAPAFAIGRFAQAWVLMHPASARADYAKYRNDRGHSPAPLECAAERPYRWRAESADRQPRPPQRLHVRLRPTGPPFVPRKLPAMNGGSGSSTLLMTASRLLDHRTVGQASTSFGHAIPRLGRGAVPLRALRDPRAPRLSL